MKVKELQNYLSKIDPGLEVLCYTEDENLQENGSIIICFNILSAREQKVKKKRNKSMPCCEFDSGPGSETIATLELTSDL